MTRRSEPKFMKLNFPNQSRSYDAKRNRICFWGYDQTIEISFYVEKSALYKLFPLVTDTEENLLTAFDSARNRIHAVADKVYVCSCKGSYAFSLSAKDF